jgi:hypothetical protein
MEELLELESFHESTKGSDLFETLKSCNSNSDQGTLRRFFTDTASNRLKASKPSMQTGSHSVTCRPRFLPGGIFRPY